MYDYNMAIQEISDYNADMLELASTQYQPTSEELNEIYMDAKARGLAE